MKKDGGEITTITRCSVEKAARNLLNSSKSKNLTSQDFRKDHYNIVTRLRITDMAWQGVEEAVALGCLILKTRIRSSSRGGDFISRQVSGHGTHRRSDNGRAERATDTKARVWIL